LVFKLFGWVYKNLLILSAYSFAVEIEELKVNENPYWSPSRINLMEDCHKRYWFEYILHHDSKISSSAAVGKHNHNIIEKLWVKNSLTRLLVSGYKSYQSCVNSSVRDWKFNYAKKGICDGKEIEWGKYDGNGWGKKLIGRIGEIAGLAYTRAMGEEPRLRAELEIKVEFEGLNILVRIDELRRNLVIRDHKTGSEAIGEYFVKKNLQLTMCSMALFESLQKPYTMASEIYPEFKGIGLDEFLDKLTVEINEVYPRAENGIHISNTIIHSAKRTERHFNEAIQTIQRSIKSLQERDFCPSAKNCDRCEFRKVCDEYDPTKYHMGKYEETFPLFANSGIVLERYTPKLKSKNRQKTFGFKQTS
jgi:hypothetical protein